MGSNFEYVMCDMTQPLQLISSSHKITNPHKFGICNPHQCLWMFHVHNKETLPILPKSNALSVIKKDTMHKIVRQELHSIIEQ